MGFPDRVPHFQVHGNFAMLLAEEERTPMDSNPTPNPTGTPNFNPNPTL